LGISIWISQQKSRGLLLCVLRNSVQTHIQLYLTYKAFYEAEAEEGKKYREEDSNEDKMEAKKKCCGILLNNGN
jgi:hypothetical protein